MRQSNTKTQSVDLSLRCVYVNVSAVLFNLALISMLGNHVCRLVIYVRRVRGRMIRDLL